MKKLTGLKEKEAGCQIIMSFLKILEASVLNLLNLKAETEIRSVLDLFLRTSKTQEKKSKTQAEVLSVSAPNLPKMQELMIKLLKTLRSKERFTFRRSNRLSWSGTRL